VFAEFLHGMRVERNRMAQGSTRTLGWMSQSGASPHGLQATLIGLGGASASRAAGRVHVEHVFMEPVDARGNRIAVLVDLEQPPLQILDLGLGKTWVSELAAEREQQLRLHTARDVDQVLLGNAGRHGTLERQADARKLSTWLVCGFLELGKFSSAPLCGPRHA
jgi:hypothetical protein